MKKLTKLVFILAQLGLVGAVHAASVSLSPASQTVAPSTTVSFDVNLDFTGTPVISGWFNLSYDTSILDLISFSYGSNTFGVSTLAVNTSTDGLVQGIGFAGSVSGAGTLGTVTFNTTGLGTANLNTAAVSGFYNGSSYVATTYGGALVEVAEISEVPVPAAAWLMGSGLAALGLGFRRRNA